MKILKSVSILEQSIEIKKAEIRVLEETLRLENEYREKIDFVKLHDCFEKLKLGVHRQVNFQLSADEKGCYGFFETTLIPLEGCSIKRLSWKGYDSRGNSINEKRCKEKANKLKEKIESMTNLKVNIYSCCFEESNYKDNSPFMILADFFIY